MSFWRIVFPVNIKFPSC